MSETATETETETTNTKPPIWFWIVSSVALLWNLMGLMAFIMQVTASDEAMAMLPEDQQEMYRAIPIWVTAAFALAVIGGSLGSAALLARKRIAFMILTASLAGVLIQMGHMFFLGRAIEVMGASAMIMPGMVVVLAVALVAFSKSAADKGWLR